MEGDSMELPLSKQQYRDLVTLVYLGNWMVNAARSENRQIKKFNELEKHIYSLSRKMGMGGSISFSKTSEKLVTPWEEKGHSDVGHLIDEYTEETFWHELIHRLAERDLASACKGKNKKHAHEEHVKKLAALAKKYSDEFVRHGIKNLVIREQQAVDFQD